jgi:hypothetical protein
VGTYLARLPFFSQLPEMLMSYLCRSMRLVECPKGMLLMNKDSSSERMFALVMSHTSEPAC